MLDRRLATKAARLLAVIVLILTGSVPIQARPATDRQPLLVGAAVRDITPTADMLPLKRVPDVTLTGVLDPIHVRVIAISSGTRMVLLISSEVGKGPYGPQFAAAAAKRAGVPLEAVFYTATHSHAAPEANSPVDLDQHANASNQDRWGRLAMTRLLEAVDGAVAAREPASVGIGYAKSYINVNRLAPYNKIAADDTVTRVRALGFNPEGTTDHTLAAIRFNRADGSPIAFVVHYAVHGTVMHANTLLDGKTGISADIPGMISTYLEQKYRGSVAEWLSGAAGDQNPIVQNEMYSRDPKTGEFTDKFTGNYDLLTYLARINFADTETALANIRGYRSDAPLAFGYAASVIPGLDGQPYPVSLQLLRIGDIGLLGFPGELFSRFGLDLKASKPFPNTLVVNHVWQRAEQKTAYHADDESIRAGGFGTNAKYRPGYLSPALVTLAKRLSASSRAGS